MIVPELVHILGDPGKSVLPAWLCLIDRAASVRANFMGKAKNLHLPLPILDRSVDNCRYVLELLVRGKTGRF